MPQKYIEDIIDYKRTVVFITDSNIGGVTVVDVIPDFDDCVDLEERFKAYLEGANVNVEESSEAGSPEGLIRNPHGGGYFHDLRALPDVTFRPNYDAQAAAAVITQAEKLNCSWVENAKTDLKNKIGPKPNEYLDYFRKRLG